MFNIMMKQKTNFTQTHHHQQPTAAAKAAIIESFYIKNDFPLSFNGTKSYEKGILLICRL